MSCIQTELFATVAKGVQHKGGSENGTFSFFFPFLLRE